MVMDDTNSKMLGFMFNGTKVTAKMLANAMRKWIAETKSGQKVTNGKTSLKELTESGAELKSIEITKDNIARFKKSASRYRVGFALQTDKASDPPKTYVFFQAKDVDRMTAAFQEYTKAVLDKQDRPSLIEKMRSLKRSVMPAPKEKNRSKGAI